MGTKDDSQRQAFIHLVRSGRTVSQAAREVGRARSWGYKWQARYNQEGWAGLKERSRVPHHVARQTPAGVRQEIVRLRSVLEAEAQERDKLGYIGAAAIYGRLSASHLQPLPGVSTIERLLRQAGMTKPRPSEVTQEVAYPHLHPTTAHQLTQVDIVPHYLSGGESIACFNSIDVVSRYPDGQQFKAKSSANTLEFLVHTWRELGLSTYLQMDNESCFSGGYKHPGVIGQAVRLALYVGVQPVFSPFYHPESNGGVERFHQDYSKFVWIKAYLENLAAVHQRSALFFPIYRTSRHHSALGGQSPLAIHTAEPRRTLPADFSIPAKLPITTGQVHFIRAVDQQRQVLILNKSWSAGLAVPDQGVWATLFLTPKGATLRIYDAAPDAPKRRCLAVHPFPLQEPVVPLQAPFLPQKAERSWWQAFLGVFKRPRLAPSTMS
ncbi:MAG: helix-turn-helix domain-containing protein [Anaerolineae bacterium]